MFGGFSIDSFTYSIAVCSIRARLGRLAHRMKEERLKPKRARIDGVNLFVQAPPDCTQAHAENGTLVQAAEHDYLPEMIGETCGAATPCDARHIRRLDAMCQSSG